FAHHFHTDHPVFSCSKIEQKQLNTWVSFQSAEQPLLGQFSVSGNTIKAQLVRLGGKPISIGGTMRESSEAMVDAMLERLAQEVFVDHKQAFDWMDRPNIALGGATPRSMSRTAAGYQSAKRVLHAIEHGGVV
ncbi:MAG: antitoxin Xre/MbcA/ParS toxin-binding domain-containing protein, partial [Pseudomonadaceae bacterium]